MKVINIMLEDKEHETLTKKKGKLTWKAYLMKKWVIVMEGINTDRSGKCPMCEYEDALTYFRNYWVLMNKKYQYKDFIKIKEWLLWKKKQHIMEKVDNLLKEK